VSAGTREACGGLCPNPTGATNHDGYFSLQQAGHG
jgi:hypothetical protein